MYGSRSAPKLGRIRNISATGIYMQTADRWPVGDVVSMTIQREVQADCASALQIDVQVRIVMHDDDGVGAAFLLPEGLDPQLWEALVDNVDAQPETEQVAFVFRLVRTILFLCRLCPDQSKDMIHTLAKGLDGARTASAVRIALDAEKLLASESEGAALRAHPKIVASILQDGSWTNDKLLGQLWAGLLVSSCTADGTDESNRKFVELLLQVTENQARIFMAACKGARALPADTSSPAIMVTPEEITGITDVSDLYRNATDGNCLFQLGLLKKAIEVSTYLPKSHMDITPSSMGLEMFDRCHGHLLPESSNSR